MSVFSQGSPKSTQTPLFSFQNIRRVRFPTPNCAYESRQDDLFLTSRRFACSAPRLPAGAVQCQSDPLFVQTELPDGRKALFNQMWGLLCPATFRDKLLFVFDKPGHSCSLTRPDLWRSCCLDGQPMLSHYLFCPPGPCLLCHCYFISIYTYILPPGFFRFASDWRCSVLQRSDRYMHMHMHFSKRQDRNINHSLYSLYLKCYIKGCSSQSAGLDLLSHTLYCVSWRSLSAVSVYGSVRRQTDFSNKEPILRETPPEGEAVWRCSWLRQM